jgi:heme oxygenase (biliverdin-IX-beta and delta-forming)
MTPVFAATVPPAAQRLRHATRDAHAAVESLPLMQALGDADLTADAYRDVLRRQHRLLAGWEQAQADWLDALLAQGWSYRHRAALLEHDLRTLGGTADPPAAPPASPSDAARWGMLYVIEGSQLGGRLIARGLRARQPALSGALRYFELGDDAPSAWRRFQRTLERVLDDEAAQAQAVAGAAAMFAHFHRHLDLEHVA